jgi:hypothetical protein
MPIYAGTIIDLQAFMILAQNRCLVNLTCIYSVFPGFKIRRSRCVLRALVGSVSSAQSADLAERIKLVVRCALIRNSRFQHLSRPFPCLRTCLCPYKSGCSNYLSLSIGQQSILYSPPYCTTCTSTFTYILAQTSSSVPAQAAPAESRLEPKRRTR